jgi:demethylmenaquinone methyltransferase/2-methoxy-6-polyprenyl-1,4-benzoquinol methylase
MTQTGKKEQVRNMFDNIARKYDFLNHFLSLGIDLYWRRVFVKQIKKNQPKKILDIATGTGDVAIAIARKMPETHIIGADISKNMLNIGKEKILKKKLQNNISMVLGDSESLEYENNFFDAVTVAFGVRNYENLVKGLKEMYRVTKNGGHVHILEFSKPRFFPFKQIFNFYFSKILPRFGKKVSKDDQAYSYLPESVQKFPDGIEFLKILESVGYYNTHQIKLTFGICTIYSGEKRSTPSV